MGNDHRSKVDQHTGLRALQNRLEGRIVRPATSAPGKINKLPDQPGRLSTHLVSRCAAQTEQPWTPSSRDSYKSQGGWDRYTAVTMRRSHDDRRTTGDVVAGVQLTWEGKNAEVPRLHLPLQIVETVNAARADRGTLFEGAGEQPDGWRNKLIWGDNLHALASLVDELAGRVDLVYIDPPFDSRQDYKEDYAKLSWKK